MPMDPVTAATIAAITAGAAAGLTDTAKAVIADSYNGLKNLLQRKFGSESEVVRAVAGVEAKPDSTGRKETLKAEIAQAKADQDAEVLAEAKALLAGLTATPAGRQIIQTATGNQSGLAAGSGSTVAIPRAPASPEKKTT